MRAKSLIVLSGVAVLLAGDPRVDGAEPTESAYTLLDLGAFVPVAMNDAGQVAANAVGAQKRSFLLTVASDHSVAVSPVPGLAGGNGDITLRGIGPQGTVVGISSAGVFPGALQGPFCSDPQEDVPFERACSGGSFATTNLGRVELAANPWVCDGTTHYEPTEVSEARGVNAAGTVVGQTRASGVLRATRFTGVPVALASAGSDARAVNSAGKIVGWKRAGVSQRATLWFEGAEHDIDVANAFFTVPSDISDGDLVCGERTTSGPYTKGFVTTLNGTAVVSDVELLPVADGRYAGAAAVSSSGTVVGYSEAPSHVTTHAVVWTDGVVADLNDLVDPASPGLPTDGSSSVLLRLAVDIDATGAILCEGDLVSAAGTATHAFLLRPRAAGIQVTPGVVDLGDVVVGDRAVPRTVAVRNRTSRALRLSVVRPPKPFTVSGPSKLRVAPGETAEFSVAAAPNVLGPHTGVVRIEGGEAAIAVQLVMAVVPAPPALVANPSGVDFGRLDLGVATRTFTLVNLEDEPLTVRLTSPSAPFTLDSPKSVRLGPKGSTEVTVSFREPLPLLAYTGSILATPKKPFRAATVIPLLGTGDLDAVADGIEIVRAEGKVEVQRSESGWEAADGVKVLHAGDRVHTGFKASVTLRFPDNSVVTLGPMSLVLLEETGLGRLRGLLRTGEVKCQVNRSTGAHGDFDVKTPTTTASVRGTEFTVLYDPVAERTVVSVQKHSVYVTPENAIDVEPVIVEEGTEVESSGTSVGAPSAIGRAGTPPGALGRASARLAVLNVIAKAEASCGLVARECDAGMVATADGWDVTVTTNHGVSKWSLAGKKVLPADAAAREILDRCR